MHAFRAVAAAACAATLLAASLPARAIATPPCSTVPTMTDITIVALSNGAATYCVSDHGWSDAWFVGSAPVRYDPRLDVLSGDDAPNLHFGIRGRVPWPEASGFGWISPIMDGGFLEPVRVTGSPWTVTTPVAILPGTTTAQSLVHHPLGLDLRITTTLDPLGQLITQTFELTNVSATDTFEDIVFADYFNFHPNGSDVDNFRKGTISYTPLGGLRVTGPDDGTLIAFGSMRGERVDDFHGTNFAFPVVPDIAIDMVQTVDYPDPGTPDDVFTAGPGDAAGGLGWRLPALAPGESTSFTIFKLAEPLVPVDEPPLAALLAVAIGMAAVARRRATQTATSA